MSLKNKTHGELWELIDELKEPFATRDTVWAARRKIRFRRMEDDLRALPLNPRVADTALMVHQSEVPNQEAHLRTKRLIANKPMFEIVLYSDDPDEQRLGQELKDGIKAGYSWLNRGKVSFDQKVTQHQQGQGLGIGKMSFIPGHGNTLGAYDVDRIVEDDEDEDKDGAKDRNSARKAFRKSRDSMAVDDANRDTKAYDAVTEDALKRELPPFRLVSVDPTTCYWREDDDGIAVIAEVSEKLLNPLLATFDEYGLRLDEAKSRFFVTPSGGEVVGAGSAPTGTTASKVKYTEIRTRNEIAILIEHPKVSEKAAKASPKSKTDRGVVLIFDNPFAPYTTGYALVPGDVTTEDAEEDKYQPPILAALGAAQELNVLQTAQLSAALEAALSPKYVQVSEDRPVSPTDEDKSPEKKEGEIPFIPGEIKSVTSPAVELEKIGDRLIAEESPYRFREALLGDATSDTSGHRLALQVAQADLQMVPYQNARSDALKELLMGMLHAVKRHGLTVYIPTLPSGPRKGAGGTLPVIEKAKLTPEMADLNFELLVIIGAETPTTKYAKQAALREQEEAGIVGYQTLIEESAENPEDELARVVEGKMIKETMEQIVPETVRMVVEALKRRMEEFLNPEPTPEELAQQQMEQQQQAQIPMGPSPESGLMNGGGPPATDITGPTPGVGMPIVPSTSEFGPSVPEAAGAPFG
jgi:hypothetical protein